MSLVNTVTVLLVVLNVINCSRYDNITGQGVLEILIDDITDLRKQFTEELETLKDRLDDLYSETKHRKWQLGMNLNPADGHVMGYETGWHTGENIGSKDTAFTKDFLSSTVWRQPANYIAIVRHHSGVMDAVKVWKFDNPGLSLLERFKAMNPGRVRATSGGPAQIFLAKNAKNLKDDPIFSVGGDLALNWGYGNNGCRIVLTGGHLSAASSNDDNTHGLGNNFAVNPKTAFKTTDTTRWMHEISNIQDCPLSTCKKVKMQGTDHGVGSHLISGPVYGNYAIYVSRRAAQYPVLRKSLFVEMEESYVAK